MHGEDCMSAEVKIDEDVARSRVPFRVPASAKRKTDDGESFEGDPVNSLEWTNVLQGKGMPESYVYPTSDVVVRSGVKAPKDPESLESDSYDPSEFSVVQEITPTVHSSTLVTPIEGIGSVQSSFTTALRLVPEISEKDVSTQDDSDKLFDEITHEIADGSEKACEELVGLTGFILNLQSRLGQGSGSVRGYFQNIAKIAGVLHGVDGEQVISFRNGRERLVFKHGFSLEINLEGMGVLKALSNLVDYASYWRLGGTNPYNEQSTEQKHVYLDLTRAISDLKNKILADTSITSEEKSFLIEQLAFAKKKLKSIATNHIKRTEKSITLEMLEKLRVVVVEFATKNKLDGKQQEKYLRILELIELLQKRLLKPNNPYEDDGLDIYQAARELQNLCKDIAATTSDGEQISKLADTACTCARACADFIYISNSRKIYSASLPITKLPRFVYIANMFFSSFGLGFLGIGIVLSFIPGANAVVPVCIVIGLSLLTIPTVLEGIRVVYNWIAYGRTPGAIEVVSVCFAAVSPVISMISGVPTVLSAIKSFVISCVLIAPGIKNGIDCSDTKAKTLGDLRKGYHMSGDLYGIGKIFGLNTQELSWLSCKAAEVGMASNIENLNKLYQFTFKVCYAENFKLGQPENVALQNAYNTAEENVKARLHELVHDFHAKQAALSTRSIFSEFTSKVKVVVYRVIKGEEPVDTAQIAPAKKSVEKNQEQKIQKESVSKLRSSI